MKHDVEMKKCLMENGHEDMRKLRKAISAKGLTYLVLTKIVLKAKYV